MDKLIKYTNAETEVHGINIVYSTPSCYLKGSLTGLSNISINNERICYSFGKDLKPKSIVVSALHDSKILDWPSKTDDFFPYSSDSHGYWTGYFTSRPTSKRMIREASATLNSAKQIAAKVK